MITEGARTRMIRVPGRKPMQHIVWTPEAEASFAEIKLKINSALNYSSWTGSYLYLYILAV
jgi:hypothetical protein